MLVLLEVQLARELAYKILLVTKTVSRRVRQIRTLFKTIWIYLFFILSIKWSKFEKDLECANGPTILVREVAENENGGGGQK